MEDFLHGLAMCAIGAVSAVVFMGVLYAAVPPFRHAVNCITEPVEYSADTQDYYQDYDYADTYSLEDSENMQKLAKESSSEYLEYEENDAGSYEIDDDMKPLINDSFEENVDNLVSEPEISNPYNNKVPYVAGAIDCFKYRIDGDTVILTDFIGDSNRMDIFTTYVIDGVTYKTDPEGLIMSYDAEIVVIHEGFTEIPIALFNSSDVKIVYFPSTLKLIYDYSLAYLHPDEGEQIQIYYPGTYEQFCSIFFQYVAPTEKFSEDAGKAAERWASNVNNFIGHEYNPEDFAFYFGVSPE
ncbi:hypothetical protein [Butyrivibrio sp. WCD2001]|uniref:hypothetical protein n=1 Tax=Butyrivibrio sp. WCD2001 TaxID=1280681 RepID=UPI0018C92958|nr:hypothetical protein [Butyrivibrio sp. WCD2001]